MQGWLDVPRSEAPPMPASSSTLSRPPSGRPSGSLEALHRPNSLAGVEDSGSEILPPLRLFELSLDSPSIPPHPSIEMPSTFSRAPSARRPAVRNNELSNLPASTTAIVDTSQDSIYVAATQFAAVPAAVDSGGNSSFSQPVLLDSPLTSRSGPPPIFPSPQTSQPTLPIVAAGAPSSFDVPPTQYPETARDCHFLKGAIPGLEVEEPQQSQAVDLFAMDSPLPPSGTALPGIFASQTGLYPFTPHDAVILPPSDEEVVEGGGLAGAPEANAPPSALRKSYEDKLPSQKRVQFAPLPSSSEPVLSQDSLLQSTESSSSSSSVSSSISRGSNGNNRDSRILGTGILEEVPLDSLTPVNDLSSQLVIYKHPPDEPFGFQVSPMAKALPPRYAVKSVQTESSQPRDSMAMHPDPATHLTEPGPSSGQIGVREPVSPPNDAINQPAASIVAKSLGRKRPRAMKQSTAFGPTAAQAEHNGITSTAAPITGTTVSTTLSEHMLVWARWRPLLYAPAILKRRVSRTRNLWTLRFCHWKGDRACTLAGDELFPCEVRSLGPGDEVQVIRHRRKNVREGAIFVGWLGQPGLVQVRLTMGDVEEQVELSRIVISRALFHHIRARSGGGTSSSLMIGPSPIQAQAVGARVERRSPAPRAPRKDLLRGYTFWISLGATGGAASKRTQKSHLITRITGLGGVVLDEEGGSLEEILNLQKLILLSNGYCRTAKTFLALVLGVPIVHLEWLGICERQQSLSPTLPLPPLAEYLVKIPGRPATTEAALFRASGQRFLMQSWTMGIEGGTNFVKSWSKVCRAAGALVIEGGIAVLPAGRLLVQRLPSASSRMARTASERGIVIVTIDWLIDLIVSSC